jgi:toxin ParE1/3/4
VKRLTLSRNAAVDLDEIALYIGSPEGLDNPEAADRLLLQILEKCRAIARRPGIYQLRPEFGPGMRRALHKRYLILFRERATDVRIERIIHDARDVANIMRNR